MAANQTKSEHTADSRTLGGKSDPSGIASAERLKQAIHQFRLIAGSPDAEADQAVVDAISEWPQR